MNRPESMVSCARLLFVTMALLIFCDRSYGQTELWSEPVKTSRDIRGFHIAATDSNGFLVVDENKKEGVLRFTRYNLAGMKQETNSELRLGLDDEAYQFELATQMGEKLMIFTSILKKESGQLQIFSTMLDLNGKKISEPALVHFVSTDNRSGAPAFGVTLSPDHSSMLLYFDPPYERKSSESLSFKCYSNELDLVWEKEILLPYTQEIVQVHSFLLDNAGNVYMMSGRNPAKSGIQWQKPQGGRYVVFFYNPKEKRLKEYDVSLKDKQVMSVIFTLNEQQDVIITGYYSNDFKFSAAGTFLFTIGAYGNVVRAASFMPFSKEFLAKLLRKSDVDQEPSLPDFYLDHIFILEDNSILLLGEQYYSSEYTITDPTTGRQTIEYRFNFDDLIVTRMDAAGRHTWNTKIPKRQYTTSTTGNCSYQCFQSPKGLTLYFNDHSENEQKLSALHEGDASLWSGSKNSVTTQVHLVPDGTFNRKSLFSNKERDVLLLPGIGNDHKRGKQILGFEEGKAYRFCLVKED